MEYVDKFRAEEIRNKAIQKFNDEVAQALVNEKDSYVAFVAGKTWDRVYEAFHQVDEKEDFLTLHERRHADESTVLVLPNFQSYYGVKVRTEMIPDADRIAVEFKDPLFYEAIKRISPAEYDYFKAVENGGVEASLIAVQEKTLFKKGYADWKVRPAKLLLDVVEQMKKTAPFKAEISIVYGAPDSSYCCPFGDEPFRETLLSKGDQPSFVFCARIVVKRL